MKTVHASEYAVQMKHCCKSFGRVVANDNVDLRLKWGEIHALLGENGSGKTTLVNMLSGIYQPDDGEIWVDGNQAVIDSPKTAYQLGIGMIHQHFKLVDVLSVQDNIVMGTTGHYAGRKRLAREIAGLCDRFGLHIDPARKAFHRTRVYIGEPYLPFPEKRRANAEDYEVVTEEIMNRIRAVRDHRAEMEAAE